MTDAPSPTNLAEILDDYELGETISIIALAGRSNKNFLLTTGMGRFVLRLYNRSRSLAAVSFEHEVVLYLAEHGFPAIAPLPTCEGATWVVHEGQFCSVCRFVEGEHTNIADPSHLTAAAEALARYHRLIRGFPSSFAQRDGRPSLSQWFDAADATTIAPPTERSEIDEARQYLVERMDQLAAAFAEFRAEDLSQVVIHGDLARGNLLFQNDMVVAVLDFDRCNRELRAADFAVPFKNLCRGPNRRSHPDLAKVSAFMVAYQAVEPLLQAELAAIPVVLKAQRLRSLTARYARLRNRIARGEQRKVAKRTDNFLGEVARLRWLEDHHNELTDALHVA